MDVRKFLSSGTYYLNWRRVLAKGINSSVCYHIEREDDAEKAEDNGKVVREEPANFKIRRSMKDL